MSGPTEKSKEQSFWLNTLCLCLPSLAVVIIVRFHSDLPFFGTVVRLESLGFILYLALIPCAIIPLIVRCPPRIKAAAKRLLIGLLLPLIVMSNMPSPPERPGHP